MAKYHNKPMTFDGIRFDSFREAWRYKELLLLQKAGEISGLVVHKVYPLLPAFEAQGEKVRGITYEADFTYFENGKEVAEDVKGVRTEAYKIKRKLFMSKYRDIKFIEITEG